MVDGGGGKKDKGVYVLWLHLPQSVSLTIGKLGVFSFPAGVYAYCGSAQKNLRARIARHRRREKPLHWHIDYLRFQARYLGEVLIFDQPKEGECCLVRQLLQIPASYFPVPGFGSSDCRCVSHLLRLPLALPLDLS